MKRKLKLYFTSDVHGYFYPTSYGDRKEKPMGLFQCAAGFERDENTLVLDGGDMLQGSAYAYYCRQILGSCGPIAEAVNDCGYDYYALGNHDFNYGREYQKEYIQAHKGTCICQNVCDEEGRALYPARIHTLPNGLRIGLVGIVTDYINVWEKKENLAGVRITDPFEAARQALAELKGQTDLNICIYHGGFECDLETGASLSNTKENVGYKICRELDFDILLTGHQHMSVDGRSLFGTWTVQPLDSGKEYHYLEITEGEGEPASGQPRFLIRSRKRKADPVLGAELRRRHQALEDRVQEWLNQPIGHLSRPLLPGDKVDMALHGSPIADFLNRVQLHVSGAQLSAVGLANEIAGFRQEVSTRDIIATYPYPNTLVVCRITGAQLRRAMERSMEYFACLPDGTVTVADSFLIPKVEHYNYDYYAGVTYRIVPQNPVGHRVEELCREKIPVKDEDEFTLCLNNYRFSGTGGYQVYTECPVVREINIEMVELIMDYFREHSQIEI